MNVPVKVLKKGNEYNRAPPKKKPSKPSSASTKEMTDWSLPENIAKLEAAVSGWLNNERSTRA